ncbi:MAG: hypothetical protein J0L84_14145 [Verrucomicrobia bacterium]|nr:hypothetical protein [Verrucomicrobiota bacterium]
MPLKITQEQPLTPASILYSPPDPERPLPLPGPWAVNESLDYRAPGGATAAISQSAGAHVYARVAGPSSTRLTLSQFASSSIASITTYSTAMYPVRVTATSSSRRRIVTGGDGGVGIRG